MLSAIEGSASNVTLTPLSPGSAEAMERWARDPEIARNVGIRGDISQAATSDWIARAIGDEACAPFAILFAGRHVGNVTLDLIDPHLLTARLSIYVGESDARGAGVGQAALRLALAEAFGPLGLYKVWLTVHALNGPAVAAYTRCGFAVEGVLRGEFLLDGERVDALRMAVVRDQPHR